MSAAGLISLLVLTLAQVPPVSGIPDLSTNKEVKIEVEIKASADMVWRTLTNFPAYDIWNPYIYPASGEPIAGRKLDLTLRTKSAGTASTTPEPGKAPAPARETETVIRFSPMVLVAKPNHELSWGGRAAFGTVQRVATFDIETLGPHAVRFRATEGFRGLLLPLAQGITEDSKAGLTSMVMALRDRAELLDFQPGAPHK